MNTDNIMFIHIPKTAGTSIIMKLSNRFKWNPLVEKRTITIIDGNSDTDNIRKFVTSNSPKGINHYPLFLLETKNDTSKFYKFTVVRNPYKRSYSLYRFYQKTYSNEFDVHKVQVPKTFEDFLLEIKGKLNNYDPSHFYGKLLLFNVYQYTQSFFIKNSKNEIGVDKIYKLENISELERDFDVHLPNENIGSYLKSDYINDYTPRCIELVKEIYHEDFINFNYSLDFNEAK